MKFNELSTLVRTLSITQLSGKDISMDDLKARYNAVIVAIGTSEAKMLPMFEHNICTESAISFLAGKKKVRVI